MIVSGGVNIYPQEAENAAHRPPEGLRRRGVRHPRRGDGRARARRRAADRLGRRGPGARTRAARVLPRAHLAHYKCPKAIDFDRELPRSRPASSTSDCCATATGATRRRASSDGHRDRSAARERDATATSSSSARASCCAARKSGRVIERRSADDRVRRRARLSRCRDRRRARGRDRDRDGTHRRPDDDGRDDAQAVADAALLPRARRSARPAARDPRARLAPDIDGGDRLVHLDLHPMNVMITASGPVVIDWTQRGARRPLTRRRDHVVLLTCPRMPGSHLDQRRSRGRCARVLGAHVRRSATAAASSTGNS